MPVMIDFPIAAGTAPRLDAVLVTHSDNDHYRVPTCRQLSSVTREFHSTRYVASLMESEGFPAVGRDIGDRFTVGPVQVTVTPADHAWQNEVPGLAIASSSRRTAAGSGSRPRTTPSGHPANRGSSPIIT
jgi:L-ascorbate metabolism protein UlaG (beta-lactamase superfamily)